MPPIVTVYPDPLPETATGVAVCRPAVVTTKKSPLSTPVTDAVKVTAYETLAALVKVAVGVKRSIDTTAGTVSNSRRSNDSTASRFWIYGRNAPPPMVLNEELRTLRAVRRRLLSGMLDQS